MKRSHAFAALMISAFAALTGCAADVGPESSPPKEETATHQEKLVAVCTTTEYKCKSTNTDGYGSLASCKADCPGGKCVSETVGYICGDPGPFGL